MRRRVTAMLVLGGILLGAGVGYAIYSLRVTAVRVVGAKTVATNDVVAAAGLHGDERILWTQMSRIAGRVRRVPGVASARADRSLPGTVVITVVERTPLVRLDSHRGIAADRTGLLFPTGTDERIPLISKWHARPRAGERLDEYSRAVLHAWPEFPAGLRERARHVRSGRSVVVRLDTGTEIRFGFPVDLEAKAQAAQAVMDAVGRRLRDLAYIDVRAPGAPASRRKGVPEATPSAAATSGPAAPAAATQRPATPRPAPQPSPPPPAPTATPAPTPFVTTLIQ